MKISDIEACLSKDPNTRFSKERRWLGEYWTVVDVTGEKYLVRGKVRNRARPNRGRILCRKFSRGCRSGLLCMVAPRCLLLESDVIEQENKEGDQARAREALNRALKDALERGKNYLAKTLELDQDVLVHLREGQLEAVEAICVGLSKKVGGPAYEVQAR